MSGKKKATIRLGMVKPKSREVFLHSGGRVVVKLYKRFIKKLKELGAREAKLEGYSFVKELKGELVRIW